MAWKETEFWFLSVTCANFADEDKPKKSGGAGASIFGGAKPVDTMAKEKEIEERLLKKRKEEEEARAKEQDREGDRRDG